MHSTFTTPIPHQVPQQLSLHYPMFSKYLFLPALSPFLDLDFLRYIFLLLMQLCPHQSTYLSDEQQFPVSNVLAGQSHRSLSHSRLWQSSQAQQKSENREEKSELDALKKQAEDKEALAKGYLEHLQRLQAEFDNYRKRTDKEKEELIKFAN